ncbi:hypothetical protein DP939_36860 [Spongiactinospora rosea]|uniref:Uncharacterized protein n=1 Tax=Spongiactinospora rosea TaxID=2248750 RepID=A0A366LP53_9ACTN|nr:hypothetical protein [Spongiactinospora rosea]RBQ15179.1 hypothetical protein DP939_36860 [Spongiactinospora rosea]
MTRRCRPHPQLVGADYWLPTEAFEVGWATAVGCNNLRCPDCGEAVRSDGPPGRTVRRYRCACLQHLETWTYWVGGEPEDLYPERLSWYCAGHPNLTLPVVLDGVPLDAGTDWGAVAAAAMLEEPFRPPGIDVRQAWLVRLFRLLSRERAALSAAIAGLLYTTDPRLVSGAIDFFITERKAPGAERITAMVISRRDWLAETPAPGTPSVSLLDDAMLLLHTRLLDTGRAADRPALALAKELALSGIGPDDTAHTLIDHDPKWLWANARSLIHANPDWADDLAFLATQQRASMRPRLLRDLAAVAPDAVRKAVTERIPEPERQRLFELLRGDDAEADLDETD